MSVLLNEFKKLKSDLIKEYDRLGMRASGDFEDSLEVIVNESEHVSQAILKGNSYAEQLEYGRGKSLGGQKGKGKLIKQIKKWIKDKGIVSNIKNDKNNNTLAFLITRKIHREGWDRKDRKGVKLISNVITEARINKIINNVGIDKVNTFVYILQKKLEKFKNGNN
jgi:hypothetical protein